MRRSTGSLNSSSAIPSLQEHTQSPCPPLSSFQKQKALAPLQAAQPSQRAPAPPSRAAFSSPISFYSISQFKFSNTCMHEVLNIIKNN